MLPCESKRKSIPMDASLILGVSCESRQQKADKP